MAIREGQWECPNCNQVNRGRDINCQGCGAVRGNVKFFLDEDAPAVLDPHLLKQANDGPDWICSFCGTSNNHSDEKCKQCAAAHAAGINRTVAVKNFLGAGNPAHIACSVEPDNTSFQATGKKGWKPVFRNFIFIAFVPLFILLFILFLDFTIYKDHGNKFISSNSLFLPISERLFDYLIAPSDDIEFVSKRWQVTFNLEQWQKTTWEGWLKSLPPGMTITGSDTRQNGFSETIIGYDQKEETYQEKKTTYKTVSKTVRKSVETGSRQVKTGVRDKGNGFFEDVYETVPEFSEVDETVEESVPVHDYETKTRLVQKPRYREDPVYDTWVKAFGFYWVPLPQKTVSGNDGDPLPSDFEEDQKAKPASGTLHVVKQVFSFFATFNSLDARGTYETSSDYIRNVTRLPYRDRSFFQSLKRGSRFKAIFFTSGHIRTLYPLSH